jgi:3'-5' exoribonuclease
MGEEVVTPKLVFVKDLKADTRIVTLFQVSSVDKRVTAQGKPYLGMRLKDKTGEIEARFWDLPRGFEVRKGEVLKVKADVVIYQDEIQLKILGATPPESGEIKREDYIPASSKNRDEMLEEVTDCIRDVNDEELKIALQSLIWNPEVRERLKDCPAAKGNHQAYLGGLLEHILRLCRLVEAVCFIYPRLNKDVMLAGAVVHDIGKVEELRVDPGIDYTVTGTLIGHVIQGSVMWERVSSNVEPGMRAHIQHIIASHHGVSDWGAAFLPMTSEAQVFHYLDMIDSRYEMFTNSINEGVDEEGFGKRNPKLGGIRVWNGKMSDVLK